MDPLALAGTAEKIGAAHGFNALLIVILIGAIAVIVRAFLVFLRQEREASIAERKESREAHLGAIRDVTSELREMRRDNGGRRLGDAR